MEIQVSKTATTIPQALFNQIGKISLFVTFRSGRQMAFIPQTMVNNAMIGVEDGSSGALVFVFFNSIETMEVLNNE